MFWLSRAEEHDVCSVHNVWNEYLRCVCVCICDIVCCMCDVVFVIYVIYKVSVCGVCDKCMVRMFSV